MPRGIPKNKIEKNEQTDATQEIVQEPVIKKGTKPGWKPAGQLPHLKAPSGFTAKWASSDPGKLTKLRAEGWIVMKPSDNKGDPIVHVDVNDGSSLHGELRYRDMVAVMLPRERKEAREEWLRNENKDAMRNILKQTDDTLKEHGVQTYSPNGQSGRIVIE